MPVYNKFRNIPKMRKLDCGILQANLFFFSLEVSNSSPTVSTIYEFIFQIIPRLSILTNTSPQGAQNSSAYLQQKLQQRRERFAAAEKAKNSPRQSERERVFAANEQKHNWTPPRRFFPTRLSQRRLLPSLLSGETARNSSRMSTQHRHAAAMLLMICIKQQRRMQALEAQSCNGVHMFGSHFVDLPPSSASPFSPQLLVACTQKSWWNAVGMQKPFFNSACSWRSFPHSRDSQKAAGPSRQIIFPARPWRSFLGNCVAQGNWQFEDFCGRRARAPLNPVKS